MNILMLVSIGLFCYVKKIEIIYFDTFGFEHVPKNIKKTYLDYRQTIQWVDIFALDSLILRFQVKL